MTRHVDGRLSGKAQRSLHPRALVAKEVDERGVESWWLERLPEPDGGEEVVTYQDPDTGIRLAICPACERRFAAAGWWPRGRTGTEVCQVYRGLSEGECETHDWLTPSDRTGLGRTYSEAQRSLDAIVRAEGG